MCLTKKEKAFDKEYWMIFLIWKIKGRFILENERKRSKKEKKRPLNLERIHLGNEMGMMKDNAILLERNHDDFENDDFLFVSFFLMWNE